MLWAGVVLPAEPAVNPTLATLLLTLLLAGIGALQYAGTRAQKRRQQVIERLTRIVEEQQVAADSAVEDLNRFAYAASHDLRAPLRAINQLAQMIVEDTHEVLPQDSRGDLELLQSRAQRMDLLLRGLLDYSRCGRSPEEPEDVDLREAISEVMARLEGAERITLHYGSVPRSVYASESAVKRVLHHLLQNTLKHHDAQLATVRIAFEPEGQICRVIYHDDGPGISYRHRENIFEVFHTLRSRDEVPTSGMGMAIARRIMKGEGGSIRLKESQGRGAVFELIFRQRPEPQLLARAA
ncbi:MAG: HAMP domain-containing sensor histidine kinase [Pseudomonadota bacterium]